MSLPHQNSAHAGRFGSTRPELTVEIVARIAMKGHAIFLVAREYGGWYRGVVVPLATIVTGSYLLAYAVTGRSLFGRGGLIHERQNPQ